MAAGQSIVNANRSGAIDVCVCMPVHNGGPHLRQALEDILAQTLADFRLLVVDDGSKDGSRDVLREYARRDARIRLTENPVRRGLIGAWRQTVDRASEAFSPTYFAWYSDHDRVEPGFLDALYRAAKADPGLVCVYPETRCIDADGRAVEPERDRTSLQTAGMSPWERVLASVLHLKGAGDIVYGLMRMDAVQACGVFRDEINPDRLLVSELSLHGGIRLVPEAVRYRRLFAKLSKEELLGRQLRNLFPDGSVKTTPRLSHYSRILREALTSTCEDRFQRLTHGLLYFLAHEESLEPVAPRATRSNDKTALEDMLRACGPEPLFTGRTRYVKVLETSRRDREARQRAMADLKAAALSAKKDRGIARRLEKRGREILRQLAETESRIAQLAAKREREIARLAETFGGLVEPVNGDAAADGGTRTVSGPTAPRHQ